MEQQGGRQSFYGKTLAQAVISMKSELGSDAMLIEHRPVRRGGLLGLGGESMVEVIGERIPDWLRSDRGRGRGALTQSETRGASLHPNDVRKVAQQIVTSVRNRKEQGSWCADGDVHVEYGGSAYGARARAGAAAYGAAGRGRRNATPHIDASHLLDPGSRRRSEAAPVRPSPRPAEPADDRMEAMQDEIARLKAMMMGVLNGETERSAPVDRLPAESAPVAEVASAAGETPMPREGRVLGRIRRRMIDSGVPASLIDAVVGSVARRSKQDEVEDEEIMRARVMKEIGGLVRVASPTEPGEEAPLIVVAIGATGVGKTTTLAKLGAMYVHEEARNIAFITLDNYRVAAAEQLRTYGDILRVPFESVTGAEDLSEAIDRHMDKDVILVDTAGRSAYHKEGIEELRRILATLNLDSEILLLVSSTTDYREMNDVIRNFSIGDRLSLVFTKTDETLRWGPILAAAAESRLPVAYYTTGQSVPSDIEPARSSRLAEAILDGVQPYAPEAAGR